METKIVNLKTLKDVNNASIKKDYNRNLEWKVFQSALMKSMNARTDVCWRGMKTNVALIPRMIHEHKKGVKCEPHVRCEVFNDNCLRGFLTLDVPMDLFHSLMCVETYMEKLKEVA
jgi:hypothetical protein